jgi:ferredoxin
MSKRAPKPDAIRNFCKDNGADLVGFFSEARCRQFLKVLDKKLKLPESRETVRDTNFIYCAFNPEIQKEAVKMKSPSDWFSGAKSVIVLGMHFPHASLDTAKITPSESVGPFAFVQYDALNLLSDTAYRTCQMLKAAGYKATITDDFDGLASKVRSCRGLLPDLRANCFASMLAGLSYPGYHGHPITPQYGVRQRFIAIVTDCKLPDDPLYAGPNACLKCDQLCAKACPTRAISGKPVELNLEKKEFSVGHIDSYACDWAKRYCLSAKEGGQYLGVNADLPVPKNRTIEALAEAVTSVKWGVQKRLLDVVPECLRVCPAHKTAK